MKKYLAVAAATFSVATAFSGNAHAAQVTYIGTLSNGVEVSGLYTGPYNYTIDDSVFYRFSAPGTNGLNFRVGNTAPERDLPNVVGFLSLYAGLHTDTATLGASLYGESVFRQEGTNGGPGGLFPAGDYTVALRTIWNGRYTPPAGIGYTLLLNGISDAPVSTVPLPATAWLMLAGIGAIGVAARRRPSHHVEEKTEG